MVGIERFKSEVIPVANYKYLRLLGKVAVVCVFLAHSRNQELSFSQTELIGFRTIAFD